MRRSYRADIDGLRAFAIIGVVLAHSGFSSISGGFAGVDVFFVISGYLIGGHILSDLAAGRFSFRRFYIRRFRRIFPALATVILATMFAGWFILLPHDYRYMGGAAFSALLSVSNIWFYETIDYFRPEAAHDPLVHTWSLGVEEQFYVIVPILLVLLWRWRTAAFRGWVLTALITISLATALLTSAEYRMEAFYLLHTRAWELFAGVLIANFERHRTCPLRLRAPLYGAGLALIFVGLAYVPHGAPWPGVWTLPSVLGTALILLAGQSGHTLWRLPALPPLRFIGWISYSLYLWHQPAISLTGHLGLWPLGTPALVAFLAALIGISTLSWAFIEQPFRRGARLPVTGRMGLTIASVIIIAIAVGGHFTKGYPSRVSEPVAKMLAYKTSYGPRYKQCLFTRPQVPTLDLDASCTYGAASVTPTVALLGDSLSARLARPLGEALGRAGLGLRQLTLSSCQPVPGLINVTQSRARQCPAFNARVAAYLDAHPEITHIVLNAGWAEYIFARSGRDMQGFTKDDWFYSIPLDSPAPTSPQARHAAFASALADALKHMAKHDRHITLILDPPRPGIDVPKIFAEQLWRGDVLPSHYSYPRAYAETRLGPARTVLLQAISKADLPSGTVHIVDPADYFCSVDTCDLMRDGMSLYSDSAHPSIPGAALLVSAIIPTIVPRAVSVSLPSP